MYNLRGGFLLRPLVIALTLGFAGVFISWIDETFPYLAGFVPEMLFPSHSDPQVAQVILGGIANSIMTVVSIVFAILLMTLTLASMQFSPRIIVSFAKDQVTQWTLGVFLGTFCFCMAALPAAHSLPRPSEPVLSVCGAMLLAVACVSLLLYFIHHISQSISVSYIADRIASETEAAIDDVMPHRRQPRGYIEDEPREIVTWDIPLLSESSGYIRFIDTRLLVSLAKFHHVKIRAARRVGQFVPAGTPLVMAYKGNRLAPSVVSEIVRAFDLGPSRTLQQDVEFGVLQIVDIALKAISPAVNDPTTAVTCVDQLSRVLIRFASRELPATVLYDPPGIPRVSVPWIDFQGLLNSAFQQIRLYSMSDYAVSLRILRALHDIAQTVADPIYLRALYQEGARVVAGCSRHLGEEEMEPMRRRLSLLESSAANLA
jgi:uncharacterized membrane protein